MKKENKCIELKWLRIALRAPTLQFSRGAYSAPRPQLTDDISMSKKFVSVFLRPHHFHG